MKLLTLKRTAQLVSVDELVAVIGGTPEQLVERFPVVAANFMGRPMIAFQDAKLAYDEWVAAVDHDYITRLEFGAYQEDWARRRQHAIDAATAAARAATTSRNRGGQESQQYLQEQWIAGRAALAQFEAAEPEITLSEFRQRRAT
jgi:hypothetical protein